jgi:hypothetical protein
MLEQCNKPLKEMNRLFLEGSRMKERKFTSPTSSNEWNLSHSALNAVARISPD